MVTQAIQSRLDTEQRGARPGIGKRQQLFDLIQRRIVRWAAEDRAQRLPVSGRDLTALGVSGPAVGRSLARIRAAFLDGEVANREEALALAEELVRSGRRSRPAKARRKGSGGADAKRPRRSGAPKKSRARS